jgi:hypothetical protein
MPEVAGMLLEVRVAVCFIEDLDAEDGLKGKKRAVKRKRRIGDWGSGGGDIGSVVAAGFAGTRFWILDEIEARRRGVSWEVSKN